MNKSVKNILFHLVFGGSYVNKSGKILGVDKSLLTNLPNIVKYQEDKEIQLAPCGSFAVSTLKQ